MTTAVPPARRRWGLRVRLIALVLAVAALALVAVDIVLPFSLRSSLISDRDSTLTSAVQGAEIRPLSLQALATLSSSNQLNGEIGWSTVTSAGTAKVVLPPARDDAGNPAVGSQPSTGAPQTVGDGNGGPEKYRILAFAVTDITTNRTGYLVAWVNIDDISATLRQLVFLEFLITVFLLALLGFLSSLIIRRELRPLEAMATAADQIAEGDVSRRVAPGDPTTEVGRLGTAFNGMLDGIGGLLDEQQRSETRLRQFVADASHELRTPVAAVRGYVELYKAGMLPGEAGVARAMDRMGFEARRMGGLVEDLLTLIKADAQQSTEREPVDLMQVLVGVVDDAAVIDRSRTWRLVGASRPTFVMGDRLRLHQLFANLLANVRTHTPEGTTATVSILPGQDEVAVAVVDDGPGVAHEALPRLFDRFFREDESRSRENGGSGLGLSIVAAIVRSLGGRILASDAPGGGLAMTVVLPRPVGTAAVTGGGEGRGVGVTTGPIDLSTAGVPVSIGSGQVPSIGQGSGLVPGAQPNSVNPVET